jgi:membrane carboxypeptidase/penicillin-binding protein
LDILVAVWVGNNDNTPMGAVASGVTGASPIWNKIISQALQDFPQNWPLQPPDVVGKQVCSTNGMLAPEPASPDCPTRYEYFLRTHTPPLFSGSRQDIPIYRPTQSPATKQQLVSEPQNIDYQNHAVIIDPLGTILCLDCPQAYGSADQISLDSKGQAKKL